MYASLTFKSTAAYGTSYPTGCSDSVGTYPTTAACHRAVDWYLVVQIGVGNALNFGPSGYAYYGGNAQGASLQGAKYAGSEFRGIATSPRTCTSNAAMTYRQLEKATEDAEELVNAEKTA